MSYVSQADEVRIESLLAHADWLRRLARSLARDDDRADDLVQETYLAALRDPPAPDNPRGWLSRVLRRRLLADRREGERRGRREAGRVPGGSGPREDPVERVELQHELLQDLLRLPDIYRRPLILRYFEDLEPPAVATRLGLPLETVRTRLRRGLGQLRAAFAARDGSRDVRSTLLFLADGAAGPSLLSFNLGVKIMAATQKSIAAVLGVVAVVAALLGWMTFSTPDAEPELPGGRASTSEAIVRRNVEDRESPTFAADAPTPLAPSGDAEPIEGPTAPSSADERTVNGTVIDAFDRPVAGAEVYVCDDVADRGGPSFDSMRDFTWSHSQGLLASGSGRRTATDGLGRYSTAVPTSARTVTIGAAHQTYGYGLRARVPVDVNGVEIRLLGGVSLVGCVRERNGAPLAGVRVSISGGANGEVPNFVGAWFTDEAGDYRSYPLAYDSFTLGAEDRGRHQRAVKSQQRSTDAVRELRVDFELDRAIIATGRLLENGGQGFDWAAHSRRIAGDNLSEWQTRHRLRVFADAFDPDEDPNYLTRGHSEGKVDAMKRQFSIQLEPSSLQWISLWAGDRRIAKYRRRPDEIEFDLVVDLERLPGRETVQTGAIEVVVVDDSSSSPVATYEVELRSALDSASQPFGRIKLRSVNDDSGRCEFKDVPTGPALVYVKSADHASGYAEFEVTATATPMPVGLRLLPATGSINGVIVERDGQPVAGAKLFLVEPSGGLIAPSGGKPVVADETGAFEFSGIAPRRFTLLVEADGFAPESSDVDAAPGSMPIRVVLQRGVSILVMPQDAEGPGPFSFVLRSPTRGLIAADLPIGRRHFGSGFKLRVPEEDLILEASVPGYDCEPVAFHAEADLEVELRLRRRDEGAENR